MSSGYWSETSRSSCGTQQPPEVLQCEPQHYHCYHQSNQAQQPPEKNVVYERVRTYSGPMNKVVQALDPIGSREVLSPLKTASSYQNLVWSDHSQELNSPTPKISTCAPNALHIIHNTEQELHSPTVKVTTYPQTTIRRYIVQNPEQEPLSPFLRGGHFFPGNNVIYEKTIRKVEKLNMNQECHPEVQCHHHIVQQPQIIHSPHCQQSHSSQQIQTITGSDSTSTNIGNEMHHGGLSQIHEQIVTFLCNDTRHPYLQRVDHEYPLRAPRYCTQGLGVRVLVCRPVPRPRRSISDHARNKDAALVSLTGRPRWFDVPLPQGLSCSNVAASKQDFESTDESEDIESLIPKGLSEFTKQQIRYILQSLENDKMRLEKDLTFKETQIKEYEELLASVRANNRQQQQGLQDSSSKCQALEENNLSLRHTLSDMEYRLKELEYCKRNLEQENKNLRMQVSETCPGPMLQTKMDEIGNHYMEMVKNLRMEKDREICKLRELSKLRQEIYSSHNQPSSGGRTTITTKKYRTQYPILGLLYDDYEYIPPGSDTQTIVIEKTEDKWTCVSTLGHF
ncbi:PREDICTED: protein POF1B [Propithecus coquereli]|uniref:protein POF1B n=1 Tax=Propithecus coquereli TaxID=379532 RepID=UPI00063FC8CA|nr:PREDICTED: protein POF1B [Propithecus coquereli]